VKYRRNGLRYASDTTDEEWAAIEPHLPGPAASGSKRATRMRDFIDSILLPPFAGEEGAQRAALGR
jgi:transposase